MGSKSGTIDVDFGAEDHLWIRYAGKLSVNVCVEHVAALERELARRHDVNRPFGAIVELDALQQPNPGVMQVATAFWQRLQNEDHPCLTAVSYVGTSKIAQGIVISMNWLAPIPVAFGVAANREEALRWLQAQFSANAGCGGQ